MKDKVKNALYGAIVGDALGVPVEFMDRDEIKAAPVTDMRGYGTYNLPKGSWSDDSSMTLCLAESIGCKKGIDYKDIMHNFSSWLKNAKFTPDRHVFDVGRTCYSAIKNYCMKIEALNCGLSDERSNGNGSLMRISPLPFYLFQKFGEEAMRSDETFEIIHNVSSLTHAHPVSLVGCDIYCSVMIEILKGARKDRILFNALPAIGDYVHHHSDFSEALSRYDRITHRDFIELSENEIKSSGYVVDTLEAALWCFLATDSYRDCVLKAVNLGRDTDTVGCVAGSIAGLYYGEIPEEWIKAIRNRRLIDRIIKSFSNAIEGGDTI
ncbi:MAG: ADP-ribosylglycohydrolase family protein [Treponema sp.]|nr:ADP-ribosylglycohydrolase family protein [Treponema sp.]